MGRGGNSESTTTARRGSGKRQRGSKGASPVMIPADLSRSLAPRSRWRSYKSRIDKNRSKLYLTKPKERRLKEHLQARALVSHPGEGPAPLEGTMAEFAFSAAVSPPLSVGEAHVLSHKSGVPASRTKTNDKDFFDVVLEHNSGPNPGWQVKTLNNRNRRDSVVLIRLRPEDIGYRKAMKAGEIVERLFEQVREKQSRDQERWNIDDARSLFYWGDPKNNQMIVWQEPYYPGEVDISLFDWRKQNSGSVTGYLDDIPIWSWYPRGGQLKHKVHVPEHLRRLAVPLPEQALSEEEFRARMLRKS